MNTRYNSSTSGPMPRALGRPVGVLPLGPRSAAGLGQRRTNSIERRPLKRNTSTGSLSSARSILSNASDSSLSGDISNKSHGVVEANPAARNSGRKQRATDPGIPPINVSRKQKESNSQVLSTGASKKQSKTINIPASSGRDAKGQSSAERRTPQSEDDDDDLFYEEQDVKFFDIPTSSRPSTNQSTRSCAGQQEHKTLTTKDILDLSQETEPYKVYEVDLHGEDLTTAPDLEKFRKLRVLDLSGNHIKRIDGLDFTRDLRELKLYDNAITTIEGLDNLKELSHLQLQHNKITKIGRGLSSLKKLQTLRLDNNQLSKIDTPELLSCSHITTLDLSGNRLESLAPLNYLPNLEELLASGNRLRSSGDLGKCRRLQEVDLSFNQLSDVAGLANLPNLQILDLSHNNLTTLKSIGKLKSLEELNINANRISQLSSFTSAFPKLQILFLCDNVISSWDEVCFLEDLTELVELSLAANPVTLEDGEMPAYVTAASVVLPGLEVIDGIKRAGQKPGGAPVMRPMSAASIISVRQVDSQIKATTAEQEDFHKNIADKFASLRSLVDTLPSQPPKPSRSESTLSSRCSSRSRIREARDFAATNFEVQDF